MKELGIIILKNGHVYKFGDYQCYIRRDNDNPKHFHDSSFLELIRDNKEDFPFIEDFDNFRLTGNLYNLAQNDCVVILNATMGSFEPDTPSMICVSPDKLTDIQKLSLIAQEKSFNYFDAGIIHIEVVNKSGECTKNYNDISFFYNDLAQYEYFPTAQYDFRAFGRRM